MFIFGERFIMLLTSGLDEYKLKFYKVVNQTEESLFDSFNIKATDYLLKLYDQKEHTEYFEFLMYLLDF